MWVREEVQTKLKIPEINSYLLKTLFWIKNCPSSWGSTLSNDTLQLSGSLFQWQSVK
jgi:hypothetical protein